jgi:hypothetical protein
MTKKVGGGFVSHFWSSQPRTSRFEKGGSAARMESKVTMKGEKCDVMILKSQIARCDE